MHLTIALRHCDNLVRADKVGIYAPAKVEVRPNPVIDIHIRDAITSDFQQKRVQDISRAGSRSALTRSCCL